MPLRAPNWLKIIYCITLLGAILPIGIANSGWVTMAIGSRSSSGGGLLATGLMIVGPLMWMLLGLYRLYCVIRVPGTLSAWSGTAVTNVFRVIGIIGMVIASITTLLSWIARPLMAHFMTAHTESGAEYFVVGVYLAMFGGVGVFSLILFELSRLTTLERRPAGQ